MKTKTKMTANHYQIISKIIRDIPDQSLRKQVSDIFGKAFNRRSQVFDFYQWSKSTGVYESPAKDAALAEHQRVARENNW